MQAPSKLCLRCNVNLSSRNLSFPALSSPEERPQSSAFSDVAQALASAGISFRFKAVGQSMYPTILNGEMLHVEPLAELHLKTGDIVLFKKKGGFKVHRIVRVDGDSFITCGDASLQTDGVVRRAQILGRVIAKECSETGRLVPLTGLAARADFQVRRFRSRVGRAWRRRAKSSSLAFITRSKPDA